MGTGNLPHPDELATCHEAPCSTLDIEAVEGGARFSDQSWCANVEQRP